ncbi:MAG: hypothetical protein V6Z86_08575 [Hyphomicrobiales bacterium]
MKVRTFSLGLALALTSIWAPVAVNAAAAATKLTLGDLLSANEDKSLELDETVDTVAITGDVPVSLQGLDSKIDGRTDRIKIIRRDRSNCEVAAQSRQDDGVFTIDISGISPPALSTCNLKIKVVLPRPLNLDVNMKALSTDIEGVFRGIDIHAQSASVSFGGVVDGLRVSADHASVNLESTTKTSHSELDINVDDLSANIKGAFGKIRIDSQNAKVGFDGVADGFQFFADNASLNLDFAASMARNAVVLNAENLVSHVTFNN